MRFEAALTADASATASSHLLQHYRGSKFQEDLCFALWRPSTGKERYTALIDEVILPKEDERLLHGNTSFQPNYLVRVLRTARERNKGVAFMHSHPSEGWQDMSGADVEAERDILAYPVGATGLPLVGMTIGSDGYWSSRFWNRDGNQMRRSWCLKTRVVGPKSYEVYFNDYAFPPPERREILRRTFDTWGRNSPKHDFRVYASVLLASEVSDV